MAQFFEDEMIEVTDGDVALLIEPEYEANEDDYFGAWDDYNERDIEFGFDPYAGDYIDDEPYDAFESDLWEGIDF